MELFDAERFGQWLTTAFKRSNFKSQAALADAAGTSRAYVSSLMRAGKQGLTGKASRPNPEIVVALAKALDENVNMALMLAGHAPLEIDRILFYGGNQLTQEAEKEILKIVHRITYADFDENE